MRIIIVFDEFQRLRGVLKREIENAISYCFDYLDNITFILSGSEMGLLYETLEKPESPLYGRAYIPIPTRKLNRNESIDFLHKGFNQLNISISESEIEEAVDNLNGIIGWLTYFGYSKWKNGKTLSEIKREAVNLARKELENLIKYRMSRRYPIVLRLLAKGIRSWSKLKKEIEKIEKREVSDRVLHDILNQLKKHSIINEELKFTDPIVKEAAKTIK